jgi:hypothetical protein
MAFEQPLLKASGRSPVSRGDSGGRHYNRRTRGALHDFRDCGSAGVVIPIARLLPFFYNTHRLTTS